MGDPGPRLGHSIDGVVVVLHHPVRRNKRVDLHEGPGIRGAGKMEMEFTFYFLSVWQWLAIAVFCVISVVPAVRILRRAGLSARLSRNSSGQSHGPLGFRICPLASTDGRVQ